MILCIYNPTPSSYSVTREKGCYDDVKIISLILMSIMKEKYPYSTPHLSIQEKSVFIYHLVLDMCTLTLLTHSHFQFQVLGTKSDKHKQRGRVTNWHSKLFKRRRKRSTGSGSVDFILLLVLP